MRSDDSQAALGLLAAQRLMDQCAIADEADGVTSISLAKALPDGVACDMQAVGQALSRHSGADTAAELQRQNRELIAALADLRERQEELTRLTRELEDTNRGVVALYAELDARADHLRRADESKSRFLSNMSHEFRTPLSSIRALSKLLLDRIDGELTEEQEKQVRFIRKAAEDLSETVDDLLDLAKIEAGKIEVRPAEFEVDTLFSALRGMLRPLSPGGAVELRVRIVRRPAAHPHRRSQGRAGAAQLRVERAQVHRARRSARRARATTRRAGSSRLPSAIRASASRRSISRWCSRNSAKSRTGFSNT